MSLLPDGQHSGMFIRADLNMVADCLVRWGNEHPVNRSTAARKAAMSLQQVWECVKDRSFPPNRAVLVRVANGWTAFFNNDRHQYLPQAEFYVLCKRLRTDTCFFFAEDRPDSVYKGSAHFSINRYVHGVRERQVMVYKESYWVFRQSGEVLPFERTDAYQRPEHENRLNGEILRGYGQALGIPFWDRTAYGPEVILLQWETKPTMTNEEAIKLVRGMLDEEG